MSMKINHKADFHAWCKKQGVKVLRTLRNALPGGVDLHVGDLVAYTNPAGVVYEREVLGFDPHPFYGRCIYLNWDCYWFPVHPDKVRLVWPAKLQNV